MVMFAAVMAAFATALTGVFNLLLDGRHQCVLVLQLIKLLICDTKGIFPFQGTIFTLAGRLPSLLLPFLVLLLIHLNIDATSALS